MPENDSTGSGKLHRVYQRKSTSGPRSINNLSVDLLGWFLTCTDVAALEHCVVWWLAHFYSHACCHVKHQTACWRMYRRTCLWHHSILFLFLSSTLLWSTPVLFTVYSINTYETVALDCSNTFKKYIVFTSHLVVNVFKLYSTCINLCRHAEKLSINCTLFHYFCKGTDRKKYKIGENK